MWSGERLVSGSNLFDVLPGFKYADFSGRSLLETFLYSALFGSTVDTSLRQLTRCVIRLWLSRSCVSSKVVDFPFVPQKQIPMVLPVRKTIETPQLQYVSWWSLPCCAGRACFARCCLRQARMVQTLQKFVEVPQSQFLRLWTSLYHAATSCLATVKVPLIQFVPLISGHCSRHRDR